MILLLLDSGINMVDDYDWKYCSGMHVGYTYELHWPHSNMGDCPTAANPWPKWQYQSHFMDGTSQCTARHVLVALHLAISPFRLLTRPPHNASTSTHLHASPIYPQPSTRLRKSTPFSALTRRFARTIQVTIQVLARRRPPSFGYPSRTPPTHTHLPRVCPRQACSAKPTRSLEPPLSRMKPLPSMRSSPATPTSQRAWSSSECTPR